MVKRASKEGPQRKALISRAEEDLRWAMARGEIPELSQEGFNQRVKEIREKTGLPRV